MLQKTTANQRGFALVEGALIIVIVAAFAGVGYYVWKQRKPATHTSTNTSQSSNPTAVTASAGTSAAIQQLIDQGSINEQNADTKAVTNISNSTKSTDSKTASIGDSYNENAY